MKIKIGAMGASKDNFPKKILDKAKQIGELVAKNDCILITGATTGLPYYAAIGAKNANGKVIGISPARNQSEHTHGYKLPIDHHDVIIYTGFGYKGRNAVNIQTSDAIVILAGSYGTLNEFTIAADDGKIIGILENTGGVADHLKEIIKICNKKTGAKFIFDENPENLISKIIEQIKKQ